MEELRLPQEALLKLLDKKVALYDIDMTLIDARRRFMSAMEEIGYPPTTPYNRLPRSARMRFWEAFLSEKYLKYDRPVEEVVNELREKYRMDMGIVLVTGRPARLERATRRQLKAFGIPYHAMLMRPQGNFEPDHKLKLRMVTTLLELGLDIVEYHEDNVRAARAVSSRFPWIKVYLHRVGGFETGFGED